MNKILLTTTITTTTTTSKYDKEGEVKEEEKSKNKARNESEISTRRNMQTSYRRLQLSSSSSSPNSLTVGGGGGGDDGAATTTTTTTNKRGHHNHLLLSSLDNTSMAISKLNSSGDSSDLLDSNHLLLISSSSDHACDHDTCGGGGRVGGDNNTTLCNNDTIYDNSHFDDDYAAKEPMLLLDNNNDINNNKHFTSSSINSFCCEHIPEEDEERGIESREKRPIKTTRASSNHLDLPSVDMRESPQIGKSILKQRLQPPQHTDLSYLSACNSNASVRIEESSIGGGKAAEKACTGCSSHNNNNNNNNNASMSLLAFSLHKANNNNNKTSIKFSPPPYGGANNESVSSTGEEVSSPFNISAQTDESRSVDVEITTNHRKFSTITNCLGTRTHLNGYKSRESINPGSYYVVEVRTVVLKVGNISTVHERFVAEAFIEATWIDLNLSPSTKYDRSLHWNPQLYVLNSISELKQHVWYNQYAIGEYEREIRPNLRDLNETMRRSESVLDKVREAETCGDKGCVIVERRRISGQFWQTLDLKNFPADVQHLTITISTTKHSAELKLVHCSDRPSCVNVKCFADSHEWQLYEMVESREFARDTVSSNETFSALDLTINAARRPSFYFWNAFFLIFLITLSSLSIFSIKCHINYSRIQTTSTLLLTLVTFKWIITNRSLPTVSVSRLTLAELIVIQLETKKGRNSNSNINLFT